MFTLAKLIRFITTQEGDNSACDLQRIRMNLGKRLADLRRKRGLATGELAARAKVTSGFISQLEHNKTSPSLTTLQRVAAALDVH
jgi:ribosome-binding protein aMBF1 (putative translation factor)